ncbi:hypothetical protein RCL1_003689 [Eukaryota sp. TZLM3-RCL]
MYSFKLYNWRGTNEWRSSQQQPFPANSLQSIYDQLGLTGPSHILLYCSQTLVENNGILEVSEGELTRQLLSLKDFFREPFEPIHRYASPNAYFGHTDIQSGVIVSLSIHRLLRREWFEMKKIALPSRVAAVEKCLSNISKENLFVDFHSRTTSDAALHPVALSCYPLLNFVQNLNTWSPSFPLLDETKLSLTRHCTNELFRILNQYITPEPRISEELNVLLNDVLASTKVHLSASSTVDFKVVCAHQFESIVDLKVVANFILNEFNEFEVPVVYWEQKLATGACAPDFQSCIYGYNDILDMIHSETSNFEDFLMTKKRSLTSHLPALHVQLRSPHLSLSISSLQSLFVIDPVACIILGRSSSSSTEFTRAMTFWYCFFVFLEDIAHHYYDAFKSGSTVIDNIFPIIPPEVLSSVGTVTFRKTRGQLVFDADLHQNNSHRHIIVKYSDTYCEELHNMLAAAGFAPEHIITVSIGPFYCTLMDFVDGVRLSVMHDPHNYSFITEQLQQLKKILFESGYVHGDVRSPNIIVNTISKKIYLLDFDWGVPVESPVALYPSDLNENITWPEGVQRWSKMTREHDQKNIDTMITDLRHRRDLDTESPAKQGVHPFSKMDVRHVPERLEDVGPQLTSCTTKVNKRTSGGTSASKKQCL